VAAHLSLEDIRQTQLYCRKEKGHLWQRRKYGGRVKFGKKGEKI